MDTIQIVSLVLGIVVIVGGIKFKQAKNLVKQMAEALTALSTALDDDAVTYAEAKNIASEFKDVIEAAIKLFRK